MKAVIIKLAVKPGALDIEAPGWIVPDTEDLLAVDCRVEADVDCIPPDPARWCITHLPTGRRIGYGVYTVAHTRAEAMAKAQRFYRAFKERGWKIKTLEPSDITTPVAQLSEAERDAFWDGIAGFPRSESSADCSQQKE